MSERRRPRQKAKASIPAGRCVRLPKENSMTRAYLALMVVLSLFAAGCEDTDVGMALQAGADAVRAPQWRLMGTRPGSPTKGRIRRRGRESLAGSRNWERPRTMPRCPWAGWSR